MKQWASVAMGLVLLAGQGAQTMEQRRVISAGAPPIGPYSPAVVAGGLVYVSGLLGNTADNKGDIEAQTKELLARAGRTMAAAGFGWGDVVDGIVYITDLANFNGMNTGYRTAFAKDFPARATVKVGLVGVDGLVEIMFVASK